VEHVRRLSVEGDPSGEQLPRRVDSNAAEADPRRAQRLLMPEHSRCPLRRRPYETDCENYSSDGLQDETAARRHRCFPLAHDTPQRSRCRRRLTLANWGSR